MRVMSLSGTTAGMAELVGGKAAGLGELIRRGEEVPAGFCVTTEAHRSGIVPEAEIAEAYERLGGGAVAVRSSATAEDQPDASFAGQHDTFLGVEGIDGILAAVAKCWDSLPAAVGVLTGVGAAAGRVTGPARVVTDPATARVEPGEILVAPTTDPGWTPLFLTAGALVTETGAIMAHGPTVAREYGIPAVISVPDATRRIATGQVVTVDGAAGTVTIGTPAL